MAILLIISVFGIMAAHGVAAETGEWIFMDFI